VSRQKLIIIISSIVFGLLVLAGIIYALIPKAFINFTTAPQQVYVQIGSATKRQVSNGASVLVNPGKYNIKVTQTGFTDYQKDITVNNGQTVSFLVALKPQTDEAKAQVDDYASQSIIDRFYQGVYDENNAKFQNIVDKDYPIVNDIPIYGGSYTITSCASKKYPNDNTKIALCVEVPNEDGKSVVINEIKTSFGYNLNDYEVIWSFY
jgi:hypothetical protein